MLACIVGGMVDSLYGGAAVAMLSDSNHVVDLGRVKYRAASISSCQRVVLSIQIATAVRFVTAYLSRFDHGA